MTEEQQKQAYQLQQKFIEAGRTHKRVVARRQGMLRELRLCALTETELDEIPGDVSMYRPVGKMFLSATSEELRRDMKTREEQLQDDLGKLQKQERYLEGAVKDCEQELKAALNAIRKQ